MACCRCGACGNAYQHGDNGCDCVVIFVCRGSFVFLLLLLMTYFTYFLPLLASPVGGQSVMDTTRTVFGRHRAGYLFPILLCVKPTATSFSGAWTVVTQSTCQVALPFNTVRLVCRSHPKAVHYRSVFAVHDRHSPDRRRHARNAAYAWAGERLGRVRDKAE